MKRFSASKGNKVSSRLKQKDMMMSSRNLWDQVKRPVLPGLAVHPSVVYSRLACPTTSGGTFVNSLTNRRDRWTRPIHDTRRFRPHTATPGVWTVPTLPTSGRRSGTTVQRSRSSIEMMASCIVSVALTMFGLSAPRSLTPFWNVGQVWNTLELPHSIHFSLLNALCSLCTSTFPGRRTCFRFATLQRSVKLSFGARSVRW